MAKIIRQLNTPRAEVPAEEAMEPNTREESTTPASTTEALAEWLCQMGEERAWDELRRTAAWQSPYSQVDGSVQLWIEDQIKALFPFEFTETFWRNIQHQQQSLLEELNQAQKAQQRLLAEREEFAQRLWHVQDELSNKEAEAIRLQRLSKASVSMTEILPYWFTSEDTNSEAIRAILAEDLQNPDVQLVPFAAELSRQWQRLRHLLGELPTDEDEAMTLLHGQLTQLLRRLSGLYVPQRRAILDVLARTCSSYSEKYIFVSPEESTRVDSGIHQAVGLGGEIIKEGRSFAVIRRDTRQTVRFAEITVT